MGWLPSIVASRGQHALRDKPGSRVTCGVTDLSIVRGDELWTVEAVKSEAFGAASGGDGETCDLFDRERREDKVWKM